MCISDYKIGRMIRRKSTNWNTAGPVLTSFNRDSSRVGLIISPTVANLAVTSVTVVTFGDGSIVTRNGGSGTPLILLLKDVGDIIQLDFIITAIGTAHQGCTIELLVPPDWLASQLNI